MGSDHRAGSSRSGWLRSGRDARRAVVTMVATSAFGCVIPLSQPGTTGGGADGGPVSDTGTVITQDGPLPTGMWKNVTGNLANKMSECGNMTSVHAKPDEDLLIAGISLNGLWGSRDGGGSWQALGTGAGSAMIINRPTVLFFDPQVPTRFWEAGIYNGGGVYETTDDGSTFTQLGMVSHTDAVSVDLTDPARATLLAGGHEVGQTLYKSADAGKTWNNIGAILPANTNCTQPLIIDAKTFLVGCGGFGGGPSGVYRSTDGGTSWMSMTTSGGGATPLRTADNTTIYWASPQNHGLTRSTDNGVSWKDVMGQDVMTTSMPVELPDKRIAVLGEHEVLISSDGTTWTPASSLLPFSDAVGLAYSAQQKAFFTWHLTCGFSGPVPVPADAIMRYDFDYTKN